ncbi:MAG: hypothetical protein JRJ37_08750 [Deltaproteobacteria bacterium]|nr:hypothetical protein [Deltaproteobacteria bacterium]
MEDTADETEEGQISQEDIDKLLSESISDDELEDKPQAEAESDPETSEPVILAEPEAEEAGSPEKASPQLLIKDKIIRICRSKHAMAAAALGMILIGSVWLLMPDKSSEPMDSESALNAFPVVKSEQAIADVKKSNPNRVRLSGFVVLAPITFAEVTYVAADIFIGFSDDTVSATIKEKEAFVRDMIYGVINDALMTQDASNINEIKLKLLILKALGKIIPQESIEQVEFERFSVV